MKVIIYTINNDPFCTAEKEYLTGHNIAFEEKNIEADPALREEMKTVADDFAGVPFSIVEKDDGTTVKLKGFTPAEFDGVLGVSPTETMTPEPAVASNEPTSLSADQAASMEPEAPVVPAPAVVPTPMPETPPISTEPTVVSTPPAKTATKEELDTVLSQLSSLSGTATTADTAVSVSIPNTPTDLPAPVASTPAQQPEPVIPQPAGQATAPAPAADSAVPEIPDFSK